MSAEATTALARRAAEEVVRREWSAVVATLMREVGDLDLAEDAAQDACEIALATWPERGVPDRPGAWITTAARRRAIDRLRREARRTAKERMLHDLERRASLGEHQLVGEQSDRPDDRDRELSDDQLRLMFLCCHPALGHESQVALTLRSVGGLSTTEIARAFLVPEPTLAQRLVRAKKKIRVAGIPFDLPDEALLPDRVQAVLTVVYLIFNEGYAASGGDELIRTDLCDEAARLGRLLCALLPEEPEVRGLTALMLFNGSRRWARVTADGDLVLLEDQDRSLWDHDEIAEGQALLAGLDAAGAGPYVLQASIAAVHARAPEAAATDWETIVSLYSRLLDVSPSPVIELNRAVALAMARGPAPGLAVIDALAATGRLDDYRLFHAARADLLRRLGRTREAAQSYRRALAAGGTAAERRFLQGRLDEVAHWDP